MDNILEAYRKLYVAFGGNESDVAELVTSPDLVEAIATQVAESIAPALEPVVIEASESGGTWSVDKTYEEISTAYGDGRRLILKMQIGDVLGYAELQGLMGTSYCFAALDFVNSLQYAVAINADESVVLAAYTLTPAT